MSAKKISVIIIALNEEFLIESLLQNLTAQKDIEIIISDGGSTDRTYEISRMYTDKVVISENGRGKQLNNGAKYATGDIYLFLHADSVLSDNFPERIIKTLEKPGIVGGAFDFEIDSNKVGCKIISKVACLRSRFLKMPYGDQGIFVKRNLFEKLHGFSNIPLMEDVDFCKRLKKEGKIAAIKDKIKLLPVYGNEKAFSRPQYGIGYM